MFTRSVTGKFLKMDKSTWRKWGPESELRCVFPMVPRGCGAKAAVLKKCEMDLLEMRGSAIVSGRSFPPEFCGTARLLKPNPSGLSTVEPLLMMEKGLPLCQAAIILVCQ